MNFTLLPYIGSMEVTNMKKIWSVVNQLSVKKSTKNTIYINVEIVVYALLGALVWFILGRFFLPGLDWLLCFIGYPALYVGLFGRTFYLYNHEFS